MGAALALRGAAFLCAPRPLVLRGPAFLLPPVALPLPLPPPLPLPGALPLPAALPPPFSPSESAQYLSLSYASRSLRHPASVGEHFEQQC